MVKYRLTEADIQNMVRRALVDAGISNEEIREQHVVRGGEATDLYVHSRRLVVECKSQGKLTKGPKTKNSGSRPDETAYEQLERYLRIIASQTVLHKDDKTPNSWMGIITDFEKYWVYEWKDGQLIATGWIGHPHGPWMDELAKRETKKLLPPGPEIFDNSLNKLLEAYNALRTHRNTATQYGLWRMQLEAGGNLPEEKNAEKMFVRHSLLTMISRIISNSEFDGFVDWVPEEERVLLIKIMAKYDWSASTEDIMRELYEHFIDVNDRKVFGEYYTPEWVAEKICTEIIDDKFVKEQVGEFVKTGRTTTLKPILDPSCGSGTFLRQAAMLLFDSRHVRNLNVSEQKRFVAGMIAGIDIHPVAVEMARANLNALGLGEHQLRVYQGDSLLISDLLGRLHDSLQSPKGRPLHIPEWLKQDAEKLAMFADSASKQEGLPPGLESEGLNKEELEELRDSHSALRDIIKLEANGVWKWYLLNQTAPTRLVKKCGRIVANPPWVTYNKIQINARKNDVSKASDHLELWTGGKMAPHFDIASLFVFRCRQLYMSNKKNPSAWVLPQAAIKSKHWNPLRKRLGKNLNGVWDLGRLAFPKAGSCVFWLNYKMRGYVLTGKKSAITQKMSWAEVHKLAALRSMPTFPMPETKSYYHGVARQGATIVPHILVLFDVVRGKVEARGTDNGTGKQWDVKPPLGKIPNSWVYETLRGEDMIPFGIRSTTKAILPITKTGKWVDSLDNVEYWRNAEAIYAGKRTDKSPKTLCDNIDYNQKLLKQLPEEKHVVIFNTSGDYFAAARSTKIIHSTLYRIPCETKGEALFLTAVFNADVLQTAFAWSRSNDRTFHKSVLEMIPIPKYDGKNKHHKKLAVLAEKCEAKVSKFISTGDKTESVGSLRKAVRKKLCDDGIMLEINSQCKYVLSEYAKAKDCKEPSTSKSK